MPGDSRAVFLSYASEDSEAAQRIADALRAAGIEVWFDQSELRGGDAWDRSIRKQIHDCALFIPLISQHSQERLEGYFRLEWKLAVDRSHRMAAERSFIVPLVVDSTRERDALVPESFRDVQWTHLPGGETSPAFVARIAALLGAPARVASGADPDPAPVSLRPAGTRNHRVVWIPVGLAALVIIVGGGWFALQHWGLHRQADAGAAGHSQPAVTEKSIAVLPFVDLSEKHDQEYFADGLADELIDVLVRVPSLRVIGRTSSFQFKNKNEDVRTIGLKLGAAHVVEGSVRRSANHVRVTAQLVRASDGVHEWSGTYDRRVEDILQLQTEMAASLGRALELSVADVASQSPIRAHSLEAEDLYFRGMHALDRYTLTGFEEAISAFRRAIDLDPLFLSAHEGLALTHTIQASDGFVPPDVGFALVRDDVSKLLKLDPHSALAHALLVREHTIYTWDWNAAARENRAALALGPHDSRVLYAAGDLAMATGHLDDAERQLRAALVVDPLSPDPHFELSQILLGLGRPSEAEAEAHNGLTINPQYVFGHFELAKILIAEGKFDDALRACDQEVPEGGRAPCFVEVYHALGRNRDSQQTLKQLMRESGEKEAFNVALALAYVGNKDLALEWLDRAMRRKDYMIEYIWVFPELRELRQDTRYKALLEKLNLPV